MAKLKKTGANDDMVTSDKGIRFITLHERLVKGYYNDLKGNKGNCTWGIGTLAHFGPCTPEELKAPVTMEQIYAAQTSSVVESERNIKRIVKNNKLTQEQFDALVSFTYNTGAKNARPVLTAANEGKMNEVAYKINQYIYSTPRNSKGEKIGEPQKLNGLISRRSAESAPFSTSKEENKK